jgi:Uma2 family endonuclease
MALRQTTDTQQPMSEDDYLAFEEQSEIKHEYVDGRIRAMTGASYNHNVISGNVITEFNVQLADKPCKAMNDMRIRVESEHVSYRYPDVVVICDGPVHFNNRVDTVMNPIILVEVLSDSTQAIDHSDKLAEYTRINTLQAYILVAQNRVKVECFMRHPDVNWTYQLLQERDAVLTLPFLDCEISLANLYDAIEFDDTSNSESDEIK